MSILLTTSQTEIQNTCWKLGFFTRNRCLNLNIKRTNSVLEIYLCFLLNVSTDNEFTEKMPIVSEIEMLFEGKSTKILCML